LAERYGLPPERAGASYADMAVLRGDPSDGLPGVAGIGEKTAAKLISAFGSVEALIAAADEEDPRLPARAHGALMAARDYLAVAPTVVRVVTDAPITWRGSDRVAPAPRDPGRVAELQRRWGLGRSVDRLVAALAQAAG
jgi:5'-3' exonuclease